VPVQITFIRHGETEGNAAGRWQGHTNSSLTKVGRKQARTVGDRLAGRHFDLVVASDLDRTMQTAGALRRDFVTDPRWREPFFGSWEDLTTEEIMRQSGDGLQALMRGEDIAFGGGERLSAVLDRTKEAIDDVVTRVDGDGSVAIVSHGMTLLTLISGLVETRLPSPLRLLGNTAIAEMVVDGDNVSIPRYNDDTHLGDIAHRHYGHDPNDTELLVVRHGQTESNIEGRWQGQQDGDLTDEGHRQIKLLARAFPDVAALYSSPLRRAAITAEAIARQQHIEVRFDDRLREIAFGAWEGLTRAEILDRFPDAVEFFNGKDVARGGTGETFDQVRRRFGAALDEIAVRHRGERVAVVSHGGATRAWITDILGLPYEHRGRLPVMGNTGYARIAYGRSGPSVVSWNLAPHLEAG
jgi:broad specificity phosphatase PhoE